MSPPSHGLQVVCEGAQYYLLHSILYAPTEQVTVSYGALHPGHCQHKRISLPGFSIVINVINTVINELLCSINLLIKP